MNSARFSNIPKYFFSVIKQQMGGIISGKNFSVFEKEVLPRQKNLQINF
jgi:hypothetical protein